jgi:tRNA (guanine26-N2/guanine27-N2)-dimethyltransferase
MLTIFHRAADTTLPAPPPGFIVHRESSTSILFAIPPHLASSDAYNTTTSSTAGAGAANVFLNPVQEYNRDLSVVAIRTWSERRQREKAAKWEEGARRKVERKKSKRVAEEAAESEAGKKVKGADGEAVAAEGEPAVEAEVSLPPRDRPLRLAYTFPISQTPAHQLEKEAVFTAPQFKFTLLEALSATGLRAIRYAKEIPLLRSVLLCPLTRPLADIRRPRSLSLLAPFSSLPNSPTRNSYVVANDLSASAVVDIKRNIEYNGLAPKGLPATTTVTGEGAIQDPQEAEKDVAAEGANEKEKEAAPKFNMSKAQLEELTLGKVRANEGDAW